MKLEGKRCAIEPFSIVQNQVKTSFDVRPLTEIFQGELSKRLSKKGLSIQESHPSMRGQDITVRGQFIQIDGGDRWLRWFSSFLAGKTVIEVKGKLFLGDTQVTDLYAKATQVWGVFLGGNSQRLLKICAKIAAKKVSKQIIKALKKAIE